MNLLKSSGSLPKLYFEFEMNSVYYKVCGPLSETCIFSSPSPNLFIRENVVLLFRALKKSVGEMVEFSAKSEALSGIELSSMLLKNAFPNFILLHLPMETSLKVIMMGAFVGSMLLKTDFSIL